MHCRTYDCSSGCILPGRKRLKAQARCFSCPDLRSGKSQLHKEIARDGEEFKDMIDEKFPNFYRTLTGAASEQKSLDYTHPFKSEECDSKPVHPFVCQNRTEKIETFSLKKKLLDGRTKTYLGRSKAVKEGTSKGSSFDESDSQSSSSKESKGLNSTGVGKKVEKGKGSWMLVRGDGQVLLETSSDEKKLASVLFFVLGELSYFKYRFFGIPYIQLAENMSYLVEGKVIVCKLNIK